MIDHLYMTEESPSENEDVMRQHKLTWHSQGAYGIIIVIFTWMSLLKLVKFFIVTDQLSNIRVPYHQSHNAHNFIAFLSIDQDAFFI